MTHYEHGQWNAICDRCGFEFKARKVKLEWTGLRVCAGAGTNECWEPRHPQEKVRGKHDRQAPPWVRPEPPENELTSPTWDEATKSWVS